MIIEKIYTIEGIGRMLMHCGQTADPLNQFSKAMKKQTAKRGKTDEDLATLSLLEWWAGLYTSAPLKIDESGAVSAASGTRLVIPSHVLDSAIREGSRKIKAGKQVSAGVVVSGDGEFSCPGVKDLNRVAMDEAFHFRCSVKVGTAKVMRTRPIFSDWGVTFSVCIDDSVCDEATVEQSLQHAGKLVGIGDWRPGAPHGGSFGRFALK